MIFSLPWFSLVSPSKGLTLNLFMKWDYKQWEIHQTSPIPFHWKRLKLALGKAVSASCSSNLATTSVGETFMQGWERLCILPGGMMCFFFWFFFQSFFSFLLLFWKSILSFLLYREEKGNEIVSVETTLFVTSCVYMDPVDPNIALMIIRIIDQPE